VQLPKDAELWVRVDAGVKLAAGTLFSLGRLPRLTALALGTTAVPTTLAEHRFWEARNPEERANQLKHFLHTLGLLGGLLIAAVDTEGRPSVGWRARHAAKEVAEVTEKNVTKAQKAAAKAQQKAAKQAAEARKQAKKQAAAAKKEAKKRAKKVTS
jgi:putative oxidoreductase